MKTDISINNLLINGSDATNFIFQIIGFQPNQEDIERINAIESRSKIKDRVEEINKNGGRLKFLKLEKDIFKNNLILIDSLLPNILSEIVLVFYTSNLSSIKDLTEAINKSNPLNYDKQFAHNFYEYKMKRLLTDVTLGMMPSKVWAGIYDATGGYLIVKENGDVLCYHFYKRNLFEDYLFANTKLETASSTRHKFGKIYKENGKFFFKLNLQIRFK
jgi:type II restriction enzyme